MPSVGWGVLHLFCRTTAGADAAAIAAAVKACQADDHQVVSFAVLGHKADLGFMALGTDLWRLQQLQAELHAAGLEIADSFVSLTEVSEYAQGMPAEMREPRLHPQLPPEGKTALCFYPMSKRREVGQNWYSLSFDARKELMLGHGKKGRGVRGPHPPGHHRVHRSRRLGMGRHPLRDRPGRPQAVRLRDALRPRIFGVRGVRQLRHGVGRPVDEVLARVGLV